MTEQLEVAVDVTDLRVQCAEAAGAGREIVVDYSPPARERQGQGIAPLELLLMSLAAGSGTTIMSLLRRMGKDVSGFSVKAKGLLRRDAHTAYFRKILLEFVVHSRDTRAADINKAIRLSEVSYCPVWTMLNPNVEVVADYRIIAS